MPSTVAGGKAVFIVDDDPSMLSSIGRLIRQQGFEAVLFDSADALRHHDHFDHAFCIVVDIDLGGPSGIDLSRWLAATHVTLPVIFITGNDNPEIRKKAANQSAYSAFLTKPFAAKSLIDAIRRAGGTRPDEQPSPTGG
jgi:FixJ family two-component response regulator